MRVLLAAAMLCVIAAPAAAQQQVDGVGIYEENLRVRLDEQIPSARERGFDAGGWFNFAFFTFNDTAASKQRTLRLYELRGWANANYEGVHQLYVRGLLSYSDWNSGTNTKTWEGDDFQEELERAWYQFDYDQLVRNRTGQRPAAGFRARVGRQFATIGTAFVLSMPLDMVRIDAHAGDWELMTFIGKTIRDSHNIDSSPFIADHQERCMWAAELTYTGLDNHRPFAYFRNNQDNSDPTPTDLDQAYEYTSRYVGVGSTGSVISPNLLYRTELVGEWGRTYSDGVTAGRDDIEAFAFDAGLEYLFPVATRPKLMGEYIFASGDSDRRTSATSTVGGNRPGTDDNAFNAFGFRDTGIAFAPDISNLHMYMAGASFYPLEHIRLFERMEIGSKVFFYHKAKAGGPISDTAAGEDSRWLGWEWDVFCDWRITSDVTYTIRYGAFQPGAAFEDQQCRQFLYTGVTYSF